MNFRMSFRRHNVVWEDSERKSCVPFIAKSVLAAAQLI